MKFKFAVALSFSSFIAAGAAVCALASPEVIEGADQKEHVEKPDGSADFSLSAREVETCKRGDGCVIITNRQLKHIIELINKSPKGSLAL